MLSNCSRQWVVGILQYTAGLQWAVGSGDPPALCRTAWGQWAVEVQVCGGAEWCGVVQNGVVWCGVVWCGVVWWGMMP